MLRVVLDTNVLVSSAVFGGIPRDVMDRCRSPGSLLLFSQPLLTELRRILGVRFSWSLQRVDSLQRELLAEADFVSPALRIDACRDPDDNRILECAVAGRADFIVTGDKDLLSLGSFQNIPILTARQFFDSLPR